MCSGYCYTQYFIDNYFTVDLYADTFEECKKHCENKGPEKCNGFKLGSDATGMVCKGTPMKKSVIKDHLVACTSPDCGECDTTVQSKWEYWSCGSGGKEIYFLNSFSNVVLNRLPINICFKYFVKATAIRHIPHIQQENQQHLILAEVIRSNINIIDFSGIGVSG